MSLALQSLVALTLIICGAVGAMPLVVGRPEPVLNERNASASTASDSLWVVESPGGRWFLHGEPIGRDALGTLLRQQSPSPLVHYLPSASLPVGHVARSLTWLRRSGGDGAVLAMPPAQP